MFEESLNISGSVYNFAWSLNNEKFSFCTGSGDVYIGMADGVVHEWNQFEIKVLNSNAQVIVEDTVNMSRSVLGMF